ncbi:hypothetical protein [Nonomuraea longispora]|nr:hypothetical protein [Nonomuraea longispora]
MSVGLLDVDEPDLLQAGPTMWLVTSPLRGMRELPMTAGRG